MQAYLRLLDGDRSGTLAAPIKGTPVSNGDSLPSFDRLDLSGHERVYEKRSTGTTGPRKTVYYSEAFYFDELFLPVRKAFRVWGLEPPPDGIASASLSNGKAWGHLLLVDPGGALGAMARLKIDERALASLRDTAGILATANPAIIFGKPAVLAALALFVCDHDRYQMSPRLVISSGGTLTAETRALVEAAMDCQVGEIYGTSEAGCVAFGCSREGTYHADETQAYVECGQRQPGRILVTMTANDVMPIQRFDTGDAARWRAAQCGCGTPGRAFEGLRGKPSQLLDLGQGRYFDLGRVNLDVLPGASGYHVNADPTVIEVFAQVPTTSDGRGGAFVAAATEKIAGLLPEGLRRAPAVVVRVANDGGGCWTPTAIGPPNAEGGHPMTAFSILTARPPVAGSAVDPVAAALYQRVRGAIDATRTWAVVYEDSLGEGDGAWHPGSRYPQGRVNCLTWLQLVLAEAYGTEGPGSRQRAMDCLRYFGGQVGFASRKHYLEHWLAFDPEPLRPLGVGRFGRVRYQTVRLEPQILRLRREFDAPLRHADATELEIEYVDAHGLREAAQELATGFYVMFAIPTLSFNERFGERCGPLGLAHSAFLEIGPVRAQPRGMGRAATVHHASIVAGRVESVALQDYLLASVTIHRGYVVCELDPLWHPMPAPWTDEALRVLGRERQLGADGFRPYLGF